LLCFPNVGLNEPKNGTLASGWTAYQSGGYLHAHTMNISASK